MSEEKKPDRMVSHAKAMDFAEAVCRASGWPVYDEEEDRRRASEAWDAQEEDEEDDTLEKEIEEESNYVEVKFYLTPTEAQDWVDAGPPWWAAKNVEQYLRNSKTTS